MFTLSTKLINSVLDSGWSTVFTTPVMEIRTGTRPDSADDAVVGDLLCTVDLPDTGYFASASGGVKSKAGTWSGTVSAGGTPTWFRIKNSADTGGASTTLPRIDGDLGAMGSGADLMLSAMPIVALDTINIDAFAINWVEAIMQVTATGGVVHEGAGTLGGTVGLSASGTVV